MEEWQCWSNCVSDSCKNILLRKMIQCTGIKFVKRPWNQDYTPFNSIQFFISRYITQYIYYTT